MNEAQKRLWQTLRLVEKEGFYLQDVAGRLFVAPEIIAEWIEVFYNRERLHETLDYVSPVRYEERGVVP
jgi:transposase InsO family protein